MTKPTSYKFGLALNVSMEQYITDLDINSAPSQVSCDEDVTFAGAEGL